MLDAFSRENPLWTTYLLFARIFGMSRQEFEMLTIDEMSATLAYIKEYKLNERMI